MAASLSRPTVADIAEDDGSEDGHSLPFDDGEIVLDPQSYIESLPLNVRRRVEGLKGVQVEYSKLEQLYKKELLELDKKVSYIPPVIPKRRL